MYNEKNKKVELENKKATIGNNFNTKRTDEYKYFDKEIGIWFAKSKKNNLKN